MQFKCFSARQNHIKFATLDTRRYEVCLVFENARTDAYRALCKLKTRLITYLIFYYTPRYAIVFCTRNKEPCVGTS